jgi:hypothetical protein
MDVYGKFVSWNMVKLLEVLGEKGLRCLLLWCWLRLIFEHPLSALTLLRRQCIMDIENQQSIL